MLDGQQYVMFSVFVPLLKEVPQGSILGPVLFSISTNIITSSIRNCNVHLYGDDTILYYFANPEHSALKSFNKPLIYCKMHFF